MALNSWLASLKADVSNVSGVQAPIYSGLGRYVTESRGVSDVSGLDRMKASDTADTARHMQAYQAKPAWALACTGDTGDTCIKINSDLQTTDATQTPSQGRAKRLFKQRGPWLRGSEQSAALIYHAHHFNCHTCIAAGRGTRYGRRCANGQTLWNTYLGS
jgi:hypothetical protein